MPHRIIGVVKSTGDSDFTVDADGEILTINITSPLYYCVQGDIINCIVKRKRTGLKLVGRPAITTKLGDEKTIMSALIRASTMVTADGERKSVISFIKLKRFYYHILNKFVGYQTPYGPCTTVDEFLSYQASFVQDGDYKTIINGILEGLKDMTYNDVLMIMKGWYKKHDMRLLKVMGVKNDFDRTSKKKERWIDNSYMTAWLMYRKLTTNPLMLHTIPFDLAVEIAEAFEIELTQKDLDVGILIRDIAKRSIGNGHTCIDFARYCLRNELSDEQYHKLIEEVDSPCVVEHDMLYIREARDIEETVARHLAMLIKAPQLPCAKDLSLLRQSDKKGLVPDNEQARALHMALTQNVSIITGAAGTGKTSIVTKLIDILKANGITFYCTSFTGKASSRIEECCEVEASTIDLMIVQREAHQFSHLIIDEIGTSSLELTWRLLKAFPGKYRITLIGDPYQLEPINWGNLLKELIASYTIPLVRLEVIYRVKTAAGQDDYIIENSKRIAYWRDKDFDFVLGTNFRMCGTDYTDLVQHIKQCKANNIPLKEFIVISPYKALLKEINRLIQFVYNADKPYVHKPENGGWCYGERLTQAKDALKPQNTFHIGDIVMATVNNKKLKISNGQSGTVTSVSLQEGVTVQFIGKEVVFPLAHGYYRTVVNDDGVPQPRNDTSCLKLAMAITVHSAQGSQWEDVIMYSDRYTAFVTRNMIYTAITRASRSVLLIAKPTDVCNAVKNLPNERYGKLSERLVSYLPQDYVVVEEDLMAKELAERKVKTDAQHESMYGNYDDGDDYFD